MNDKVVYLHRNPNTLEVFYVGMGSKERAYNTASRNIFWKRVVNKRGLYVDIVANNLSIEDAYDLEMLLISEYGRRDLKLGSLVNLDDGGSGAKGHIPTINARKKTRERLSKKVINTVTGEVLSSATNLCKKYSVYHKTLRCDSPNCDWMYLEDYNNGKHLTEAWVNRYRIEKLCGDLSYKIINTETGEIYYSLKEISSVRYGEYSKIEHIHLSQKVVSGKRRNNSDYMLYEDYQKGKHLTDEWIKRKNRKKPIQSKKPKVFKVYDFKLDLWIEITSKDWVKNYNIAMTTCVCMSNGRYCREEYKMFDKAQSKWKKVLDKETGIVEKFNQWHLADKLGVKNNNVNSFMRGIQKVLYRRYELAD